jgi:hypothetical protein
MIDEPDAYLHPQMVETMYKVLRSFSENFDTFVMITTHSPTSAALAPEGALFLVENNGLSQIEKDHALSELLDGVTQISLSPYNRRQVFVESEYDANVYQAIYTWLVGKEGSIDPKISLSFVSSGAKMPEQLLKDKAKQFLGIDDPVRIQEFVDGVNGVGSCVHVLGQVDALVKNDNETVRGIIDWDLTNHDQNKVSVLAKGVAYCIENLVLDPICIQLLLLIDRPDDFTVEDICGEKVVWQEWLDDANLLQSSVDGYIKNVMGRENLRDVEMTYFSGVAVLTDSEYMLHPGHPLEEKILKAYPMLNGYKKRGKDGEIKQVIVQKAMIFLSEGRFIPTPLVDVISSVQN